VDARNLQGHGLSGKPPTHDGFPEWT
jgi:hypothetical protein